MTDVQRLVGQALGQYELTEVIGKGGMGAVYRGYQPSLKRQVAIKVLPLTLSLQAGYLPRFTREAETAAALEHAHIIPIYDYGAQDNVGYVVMRLLNGGSLADRLREARDFKQPLPSVSEISQLVAEVGGALDYAHSHNVIHRDIKLGNIMFDNQGAAFVVDFGIAKLMDRETQLTNPGALMGTPPYMAPELWRGEEITPAIDQYALGVVTYALLTGQMPFEGKTPFDLMRQHIETIPPAPHTLRPKIPVALGPVMARVMAKEVADRFPTLTAFAQAFERAIHQEPIQTTGFFTTPLVERTMVEPTPDPPPNIAPIRVATPTPSKPAPVQEIAAPILFPDQDTFILPRRPEPPSESHNVLIVVGIVLLVIVLILGVILIVVSRSKLSPSASVPSITTVIRLDSFK